MTCRCGRYNKAPGQKTCYRCAYDAAGTVTWFSRFKMYPKSVIGHIAQGAGAALCVAVPMAMGGGPALTAGITTAAIWYLGFRDYQFGSAKRKEINTGRTDTMGLDTYDFIVGFLPIAVGSLLYRVFSQ